MLYGTRIQDCKRREGGRGGGGGGLLNIKTQYIWAQVHDIFPVFIKFGGHPKAGCPSPLHPLASVVMNQAGDMVTGNRCHKQYL